MNLWSGRFGVFSPDNYKAPIACFEHESHAKLFLRSLKKAKQERP